MPCGKNIAKAATIVPVVMFVLSSWLVLAHFYFRLHLVYDEVCMDVLIVFDVAKQARQVGCQIFVSDYRNWPALFAIWLSIMYWAAYTALPLIDYLDTFFLLAQSIMALYRMFYALCRSYFLCNPTKNYAAVSPDEVEDDDCEIIVDLTRMCPDAETDITHVSEDICITLALFAKRCILGARQNILFDTEENGFSLISIAAKTDCTFIKSTCWIIYTPENIIVIAGRAYNFQGHRVQKLETLYTGITSREQHSRFHEEKCAHDFNGDISSKLVMHRILLPVVSSSVGRFEIHGEGFTFILSDELQNVYFTMGKIKLDSDVYAINIYKMD